MNTNSSDGPRFRKVPADAPDFAEFSRTRKLLREALADESKADIGFLRELGNFQDPDGSFKLTDTWKIPSDARVDFCYMPTYIGAAIFMREFLKQGKPEADFTRKILESALTSSLGRGLSGHGYEGESGTLEALDVFKEGGLRAFLDTAPNVCPEFHAMVWNIIDSHTAELRERNCITGSWGEDYTDHWERLLSEITPQKRYYLAYGSNMSSARMLERCPDAKRVGNVYICGWKLTFHFFANIEPVPSARTPAVIWELHNNDEQKLNRCEGFPKHYQKDNIIVELNGSRISAMAYVMTPWKKTKDPRATNPPDAKYIDTMMRGYSESGFDGSILLNGMPLARRPNDNR
jgi:hypothetical protein